jgi:hypothetical protein
MLTGFGGTYPRIRASSEGNTQVGGPSKGAAPILDHT